MLCMSLRILLPEQRGYFKWKPVAGGVNSSVSCVDEDPVAVPEVPIS